MNKIILTLATVMTMSFAACAQNKGEKIVETDSKTLVVPVGGINLVRT